MADLLLQSARDVFAEVVVGEFGCDFHGGGEVFFLEEASHFQVDVFVNGVLLGQLLDQPVLHGDQLVLQGDIALLAHVQGDNQPLHLLEVGLEVAQGDVVEGVQDLVVLGSVVGQPGEGLVHMLLVDLVVAHPGEGTGDGHVEVAIADRNYVADALVQSIVSQQLIALVDTGVGDLSVGDEDELLDLAGDELGGYQFRAGPAPARLIGDGGLQLLLGGEFDGGVPEVVLMDLMTVKSEQVRDCVPVVVAAAHRPADVYHETEPFLFAGLVLWLLFDHAFLIIDPILLNSFICKSYEILLYVSRMRVVLYESRMQLYINLNLNNKMAQEQLYEMLQEILPQIQAKIQADFNFKLAQCKRHYQQQLIIITKQNSIRQASSIRLGGQGGQDEYRQICRRVGMLENQRKNWQQMEVQYQATINDLLQKLSHQTNKDAKSMNTMNMNVNTMNMDKINVNSNSNSRIVVSKPLDIKKKRHDTEFSDISSIHPPPVFQQQGDQEEEQDLYQKQEEEYKKQEVGYHKQGLRYHKQEDLYHKQEDLQYKQGEEQAHLYDKYCTQEQDDSIEDNTYAKQQEEKEDRNHYKSVLSPPKLTQWADHTHITKTKNNSSNTTNNNNTPNNNKTPNSLFWNADKKRELLNLIKLK